MKQLIVFFLFACALNQSSAQIAKLQLGSDEVRLGEQTILLIYFQYRIDSGEGSNLIWPNLQDTLSKSIEIIGTGKVDTTLVSEEDPYLFQQSLQIELTSFDTGYHVIKPLQFQFNGVLVESNPALLHVQGMNLDQTAEVKDIKSIRDVNYTLLDRLLPYWWVLLIVLGIVLLFFVLKKLKRSRPPLVEETATKEIIPAHITAIEKLTLLKEKGLWQKGLTKAYHTELTEILRGYIEDRFAVPALEQTSNQLLQDLRNYGISKSDLQLLPQLLRTADFVKFAKYKPIPEENEMAMKNALSFIEQTSEVTQSK
ncbi:MAG: hypothetical protein ACJAU0_000946 [Flavobacteriales bacterium]|jgi:hypothetical protein